MKLPGILHPTRKKIIFAAVLILGIVLVFIFLNQKKQTPAQLVLVKKQNIRSTISASGVLTGKTSVNLKFKSAGRLAYLNVKEGDKVTSGQTIAGLDTQALSIALQQARNTLTDKRAILDKIYDDVKDHDKDESFTQKQARTTAETAANNAYDGVKEAERAFQDAVIFSPISGIVTQTISASGQVVSSADLIAQIVDTTEIYFDTEVDEADLGAISLDLLAQVTLDAYPNQVFEGSVEQIYPQTKKTSSGATVVEVRIKLVSPPLQFVNELSGQAQIITAEKKDALSVPLEALRDDGKVVMKEGSGYKEVKVVSGIQSETDIEITDGIKEGEEILLNPPLKL